MQYSDKIIKNGKSKGINLLLRDTGFTLNEIIVVIIITGVLASLALPRLTRTIERTRAAEGVQMLTALLGAQKIYQFENGSYATVPNVLDVTITTASYFTLPPTVFDPAPVVPPNPIAKITRTGSYSLCINEEGTISCVDGGGGFTCAEAGITNAIPAC